MPSLYSFFFFFNDTATTEIYTLSLHDALPICSIFRPAATVTPRPTCWLEKSSMLIGSTWILKPTPCFWKRSEEHTSELRSQSNLVCRLLLEKKKKNTRRNLMS